MSDLTCYRDLDLNTLDPGVADILFDTRTELRDDYYYVSYSYLLDKLGPLMPTLLSLRNDPRRRATIIWHALASLA